jgi:hypothetical protein
MDSNTQQTAEIDFKDLFFVILKKAGLIILVAIVLAGALFGYKKISSSKDANILDASVRLSGESDVDYAERVQNINHAEDIIRSIDALNVQIDNQRDYVADSIFMQINPINEAVTSVQLVVTIDDANTSGMDSALISSYSQDLRSGEYLVALADELGTKPEYLKELITVSYTVSEAVVVNVSDASGSAGSITVMVIGPSTELTDKIMDYILAEAEVKSVELNSTIAPHTVTIFGKQNYYTVDNNTRDLQYNAANRIESIQRQIGTFDDSLDEVASKLGVNSKSSLYAYFSFDDNSGANPASGGAVKFAAIGFIAGAFLATLIIVLNYIFGKKFATQANFFARFPWVKKIGVAKPTSKRNGYARFIDKKTGDDNDLSNENSYKLIAANIKNLTSGMKKILVTGTADPAKVKELVNALNIQADVKNDFFTDPEILESVSEYDGIILVEQRSYSNRKLIAEELKLIANTNTKLIGAVVI